jgi:putative FmdB family regulatory protein
MPIYEFKCKNCGHVHEFMMKMSDPNPVTCSHCSKDGLEKLLSRSSFQLKGTGWYTTDFRGNNNSSTSSAPAAPSADKATTGSNTSK